MAFAQQTVKGSVKDSKGKPVAGATVIVVGTSRATTTSPEGGYSIEAQAEETLQFNAQGYQNVEIKVGLSSVVDAVLLPAEKKQEAGADYVVTQMFFDNQKFFEFVDKCREEGITIPIIPGLKPITAKTSYISTLDRVDVRW